MRLANYLWLREIVCGMIAPEPYTSGYILTGVLVFSDNFINIYFKMQQKQFKKLRMYLPRQPLVNQRPWLIAGILLVILFLLIAIYCYINATRGTPRIQPGERKDLQKK